MLGAGIERGIITLRQMRAIQSLLSAYASAIMPYEIASNHTPSVRGIIASLVLKTHHRM